MSTREVADLLGIPRSTVYELARRPISPRDGSGAAGCSYVIGSPPPSHRSMIRAPGASKRRLKSLERYSTALFRNH